MHFLFSASTLVIIVRDFGLWFHYQDFTENGRPSNQTLRERPNKEVIKNEQCAISYCLTPFEILTELTFPFCGFCYKNSRQAIKNNLNDAKISVI